MESFNNYYDKLFNEIPSKYKTFGHFGEEVWNNMVTEGLITSYPKETVVKFLKNFTHQLFSVSVVPAYDNSSVIEIYVETKVNRLINPQNIKSILDSKLKVYGYFVGKIGRTDHFGKTKLLIEPKFPTLLSPDDKSDAPFYHITTKIHLDEIMGIGLTPRDTTTIFSHPGNRLYLIQTYNHNFLQMLKEVLSHAKRETVSNLGKRTSKWYEENMIILEVDASDLTLYVDPMFDESPEYNAVFTQQNISPDKIKITDY